MVLLSYDFVDSVELALRLLHLSSLYPQLVVHFAHLLLLFTRLALLHLNRVLLHLVHALKTIILLFEICQLSLSILQDILLLNYGSNSVPVVQLIAHLRYFFSQMRCFLRILEHLLRLRIQLLQQLTM